MKRCLIVVDYQNDFVCGSLGFAGAEDIESRIAEKIREYRKNGDDVIFTLDTHNADYLETREGHYLPVEHCLKGSDGHDLYGKVADECQKGDLCFEKNTYGSDALFEYLKKTPYESIELCGVVTNICVISNAVLAKTAQPETDISIDALCVASNDEALHSKALDVMAGLQIEIANRGE